MGKARLDPRSFCCVLLRSGAYDGRSRTFDRIARETGMLRERARQRFERGVVSLGLPAGPWGEGPEMTAAILRAMRADPDPVEAAEERLDSLIGESMDADSEMRAVEQEFLRRNASLVERWADEVPQTALGRLERSDLVLAGTLGMAVAFRSFDPDRGYRFSTWATWIIRGKIWEAVREGEAGSQEGTT